MGDRSSGKRRRRPWLVLIGSTCTALSGSLRQNCQWPTPINNEDRKLTWQIGTLYQVGRYDAHQASHADQAAQSKDAGQHELLTCFKFQSPNHVQRHAKNYDIKCHVGGCHCSVIRLEVDALVCESGLRIPHSRERMALEYEAEDSSYGPCNACRADDPRCPFECHCIEDAAIHQQDGNLDHDDCERVSD